MFGENIIGRHKMEVDTPALLLDLGAVERNIKKMAGFFKDKTCKLRPHAKTHKLPLIAHKQVGAGAIGITCATLQEAKIFLEAGLDKVLIANEVVGTYKIKRLVNLSSLGELIVCVDNIDNARQICEAAASLDRSINCLVEVNVGLNRCGVEPGARTLDFVKQLSGLKHLTFRGLMGYEGGLFILNHEEKVKKSLQCNRSLVETKEVLERDGFPVEIVSAGGSNTYYLTGVFPGITEVQVGSYVTMDQHNRSYGLDFEQAITVLATVISRPDKRRAVTDAGRKSLSVDEGMPTCLNPDVVISNLNEEHGHLTIKENARDLEVGDKIEIVPSHGCTTIPYFDHYVVIQNEFVVSVMEIRARGNSG